MLLFIFDLFFIPMSLIDFYERTQNSVLSQNLNGTYVKRRPSKYNKIILSLGIINLALAISSFITFFNIKTTNITYASDTQSTIYIPKGINYLYIDIDGIYQNYLSYNKSINYSQLKGKTGNLNLSNTSPFDYNEGLVYYPAGAIAATYFQDSITIDGLEIETDNIARNTDTDLIGFTSYLPDEISIPENWTAETNQGTTPLNTFEGSGLPILNERFVNWITTASFSNFKKLWGIIDNPEAGEYTMTVISDYDLANKKSIFISEKSILGIPNYYAVMMFVSVGLISIGSAIYLGAYGY